MVNSDSGGEIGLRVNHLGLNIPGQVIRLDLYRLVCYFHSSKYLAGLSDGGDYCPWQGFRDEFQSSEIIRILLQTPVAIRFIGQGHADGRRGEKEALEEDVGLLFKNIAKPEHEPLPLREGWKPEIDMLRFVEACDALAQLFA